MCRRTPRARWLAPISVLLALLAPAAVGASRTEDAEATPVTLLVVQRLHSAGGLPAAAKGQPALNDALTTGVVRYLDEHKRQFEVWDSRRREPLKRVPGQTVLFLEGDLSRVEGERAEKDTYLLTMRLFRDGSPRALVAQWSGSARSLIYLTNNLHSDNRFSRSGLLGELGDRVVETTCALASPSRQEQERRFARMLARIKTGPEVQAALLPEAASPAGAETPLVSGASYQVEVASRVPGTVVVIDMDENGRLCPLLIPAPGKEMVVLPGKPLRLPAEGTWRATKTQKPLTEEIVVLVRQKSDPKLRSISIALPPVPRLPSVTRTVEAHADALGLDGEPDVQVIDGGNRVLPRSSADPDVARLMTQIEADDPGTWLTARVKIRIEPAKK